MHILESYALTCGQKIDKCHIHEEEIETPEKYITFHGYSPKGNSKQYNRWQDVIDGLNIDYEIVQVGAELKPYKKVNTRYLGKTNYNSLAYLIKCSSLHFGFDSLPLHLASHYDKKIVGIYSYYAETCGPYFSTNENTIIIEPDFSSIKPTYNYNDPNDLINTIDPNVIIDAICKLLEIEL